MRIVLFAIAALVGSAQAKPFDAEHLVKLDRVGAPSISPDGELVVFAVRHTDMENDKGSYDLWLRKVDGNRDAKRLTSHEANDTSPSWSADGRFIYFLSSRSGSSQVWRIPVRRGEAEQVTDLALDIGNFKLSPTMGRMAVTMSVYMDCENLQCTIDKDEKAEESSSSAQVYDSIFMRHWDHWLDDKRSRLFTIGLDDQGLATGNPVLISTIDADVPSRPFGGDEEFNFSSNGDLVYFTARLRNRNEAWSTNFNVYQASSGGISALINLTAQNTAWDTAPVVSPDGRYLAYLAMSRPGFEADRFRIMLTDLESGRRYSVADEWDRSPSSMVFSTDSSQLFVNAQDVGHKTLWAIPLDTGRPEKLLDGAYISSFDISADHIVYAQDDFKSPSDLYRSSLDGKNVRRLTHFNRDLLKDVEFGDYEQFSFKGWNDETVHGFVVKPVGYQAGQKYPVAFLIHGGPQGSFANHFHYRWNPQTYAGQGFAAVIVDFHGSTGYGQAFTDSISGDWGDKPLIDLKKGLAHAVEEFDFLDSEKVCALGASYGGYMINWIAGNWEDGFACLVNHDGIFDNRSMYYTTEELWFPEWEHGGSYFANPQGFEKHNPANHVDNWETPMLVIHGELDYRVPVTQGIATFTALQRRGITSRFVYFPDENHWVLKPNNSIRWHHEVNRWLHQFLD